MLVLATLIRLTARAEPKMCVQKTSRTVRIMRHRMSSKLDAGLTSVAMLGRIGVRSVGFSTAVRYTSVRMNWFTKLTMGFVGSVRERLNHTPESMPSPSNQCASRPKSELVTGLPPLRTYMPPSSSSGIRPVHETGVGGHVVVMGAKLPARYLQGISQGDV
jgi:hypothetical protein